jgi:queuine tRNA-ribosyltransferase
MNEMRQPQDIERGVQPTSPSEFIPILNSDAGSCLTLANWEEIGISTVAYHLDALLMKPGLLFLQDQGSLRDYSGWQGSLILNAAALQSDNKEDSYTLRSHYDGSKISISSSQLLDLILSLKPDRVILPAGLNHYVTTLLSHSILPFFPVQEGVNVGLDDNFGRYLFYNVGDSFSDFLHQIEQESGSLVYTAGHFNWAQQRRLRTYSINQIETNQSALDGLNGLVYSGDEVINILDSSMTFQYEVIQASCSCPTCSQKLTRAYLHHLLVHTPLLCQRFLIQHNVFCSRTAFT